MPDEPSSPSARQNRSIVTHDLLCNAAEAALREGGLASCTIQEVATRAGRSAGSVYRRFGDKDRMIVAVMERCLERALSANEANLRVLRERHPRLADRLKAIVEGTVAGQRSQWRLVQAFREAASRSPNSDLPASMARMRNATLDLAKQALYECSSEIMHPDKERAVDFAVRILAGAMEGAVHESVRPISDSVFQSELYKMLHAYLM